MRNKPTQWGLLTLIGEISIQSRWRPLCMCICGSVIFTYYSNLYKGKTKSCGCGRRNADPTHSALRSVMSQYKGRAKRQGKPFELSETEFFNLIVGDCWYCGDSGNCHKKDHSRHHSEHWKSLREATYTGIDRVNSEIGYSPSNCVSCCIDCNKAKNTMSQETFITWVRRVNNNLTMKELQND